MSTVKEEKQQFSLHKNMIYHLIDSQAGSLSKAIAENVMNSIDAHATEVEITLKEGTAVIRDNGKGFESREEILKCFSVFGFEHDDREREIGRFGLGRAQLWGYASTLWRTNNFELDVDIKGKGIDYDLREGTPYVKGVTIEAKFYERINIRDIGVVERELQEQVLYSRVKVIFNGRVLNRNLDSEKWNDSIDEAYIRLNESASLSIYNLGIFVCNIPTYKFGVGGVVVTKPGHAFHLNIARNAVIESKCPLWRKIKPKLEEISGRQRATKKTLTAEQKRHLRKRWYSEGGTSENMAEFYDMNLFQCVDKRWHSMKSIMRHNNLLSFGPEGVGLAKRINEAPNVLVLNKSQLDELNVSSIKEFIGRMVSDQEGVFWPYELHGHFQPTFELSFKKMQYFDNYVDIDPGASMERRAAKPNEVTLLHKAVLAALRTAEMPIIKAIKKATGYEISRRQMHVGVAENSLGWTDGSRNIWIEASMLDKATMGLSGAIPLVGLLVHEYLHLEADADGHAHPPEFFERFEAVMVDYGMDIGFAMDAFLRRLATELKGAKKRLKTADVVKSLSFAQDASSSLQTYIEKIEEVAKKDGLESIEPPHVNAGDMGSPKTLSEEADQANEKASKVIDAVMHSLVAPKPLADLTPRISQTQGFPLLGIDPAIH